MFFLLEGSWLSSDLYNFNQAPRISIPKPSRSQRVSWYKRSSLHLPHPNASSHINFSFTVLINIKYGRLAIITSSSTNSQRLSEESNHAPLPETIYKLPHTNTSAIIHIMTNMLKPSIKEKKPKEGTDSKSRHTRPSINLTPTCHNISIAEEYKAIYDLKIKTKLLTSPLESAKMIRLRPCLWCSKNCKIINVCNRFYPVAYIILTH